jgi:adenosylcobinamide amidohydrolase
MRRNGRCKRNGLRKQGGRRKWDGTVCILIIIAFHLKKGSLQAAGTAVNEAKCFFYLGDRWSIISSI